MPLILTMAQCQVTWSAVLVSGESVETVATFCAVAAIAKYGKGQSTDDLALAVDLLFERNLLPRLNPMASLVSNDFRTERLYTEEVDMLLKQHQVSRQLQRATAAGT
eukprot:GHRQ01030680.1.p1 GENE.GHRQ01030680.1~~GHRQ01030680.1.p1  ORF type:complete len:107 (-),score=48.27 GHRQ01030680.1:584-904(-)